MTVAITHQPVRRHLGAKHGAKAGIEADETHVGKIGIGDQTVQPVLAVRFYELVVVGLRQKRNPKLEADREYGDISRNSLSARHDDCLAVITVECAANRFDPAGGHHRKEFRCCDRHRAVDSIFDPLFRYHSTLLQLQLQLEKTFERPPVRPYQRFGDGMGCARHGAHAPTAEHFLLGADVENPFEIDEPSDEVRNSPHRLAIDQRDLARAGVDGIDRNIGCGFRAAMEASVCCAECRILPPAALKASSPGWLIVWGSLNWPVQTATKSNSSGVTFPSEVRISSNQPGMPEFRRTMLTTVELSRIHSIRPWSLAYSVR